MRSELHDFGDSMIGDPCASFHSFFFLRFNLFIFRERGREGERERKH